MHSAHLLRGKTPELCKQHCRRFSNFGDPFLRGAPVATTRSRGTRAVATHSLYGAQVTDGKAGLHRSSNHNPKTRKPKSLYVVCRVGHRLGARATISREPTAYVRS